MHLVVFILSFTCRHASARAFRAGGTSIYVKASQRFFIEICLYFANRNEPVDVTGRFARLSPWIL